MIKVDAMKNIRYAHHHFLKWALSFWPNPGLRPVSISSTWAVSFLLPSHDMVNIGVCVSTDL